MSGNGKHRTWLARNRKDADDIPPVAGVVGPAEFYHELQRERSRSGRTGLPLSMVVFYEVNGSNGNGGHKPQELVSQLGELLTGRTRCTDILGWVDSGKIALLLPDTDVEGACKVVADVRERFAERCGGRKQAERILYRVHTSDEGADDNGVNLEDLSELGLLQTIAKGSKRSVFT